jgi:hypothetical protein
MMGYESGSSPLADEWASGEVPRAQGHDDDFPTCLAEALDILADRAKRHGLVEVMHLIEVAALATRDSALLPADRTCQPERESACMPCSPA